MPGETRPAALDPRAIAEALPRQERARRDVGAKILARALGEKSEGMRRRLRHLAEAMGLDFMGDVLCACAAEIERRGPLILCADGSPRTHGGLFLKLAAVLGVPRVGTSPAWRALFGHAKGKRRRSVKCRASSAQATRAQLGEPLGSGAINCDRFGRVGYRGHVVCSSCGARYQIIDADGEGFAPSACTCGVRLMPEGTGAPFSGRVMCQFCYANAAVLPTRDGAPEPTACPSPWTT